MSIHNRSRLLACYLLLCAAYQAALRFRPDLFPYSRTVFVFFNTSWFYFANPRVGFFELNNRWLQVAYSTSTVWLFMIAVAIAAVPMKPVFLKSYAALEFGMALPSIWHIFTVWLVRVGFLTGYSFFKDTELQTQSAVFLLFSVVPFVFAMSILRAISQARRASIGTATVERADCE
jgi:hypothetical protein